MTQTPRSRANRGGRFAFSKMRFLTSPTAATPSSTHSLGSGLILIAEKTEPVCHGVEVDLLYVDVIARRYEAATGDPPTLIETGGTFEALGAPRATEAAPVQGSSSGAPSEVSPELPEAVAPSSARVPQWKRSEVRIPSAPPGSPRVATRFPSPQNSTLFSRLRRQRTVCPVYSAVSMTHSRARSKVSGRKFTFPRLRFATCPPRPISNCPWEVEPRHLIRFG